MSLASSLSHTTHTHPTYLLPPAGLLVWLYSPILGFSAIDDWAGRGSCIFVTGGAAVLGRSPVIGYAAIFNERADIWIDVRKRRVRVYIQYLFSLLFRSLPIHLLHIFILPTYPNIWLTDYLHTYIHTYIHT